MRLGCRSAGPAGDAADGIWEIDTANDDHRVLVDVRSGKVTVTD